MDALRRTPRRGEGVGRLAVVVTGGTVGSEVTGGKAVLCRDPVGAAKELVERAATGMSLEAGFVCPFVVHSEDIEPSHWVQLAEAVASMASGVDGVVVLHGTDTAAYTSAALSYLLLGIDAPVVVTGASVPPSHAASDALANVRGAMTAANGSLPAGCYLAFGESSGDIVVHLGTRVRKVAAAPVRFESVARAPVAVVADDAVRVVAAPGPDAAGAWRADLDDQVQVITCHPGLRIVELVEWLVDRGTRGVVLELYAGGTAPVGDGPFSAARAAREATSMGVVVAAVSREGWVGEARPYPSTAAVEQAGAVLLDPLTAEAAVAKLMWATAQASEPSRIAELLRTPLRGDLDRGHERGHPVPEGRSRYSVLRS